MSIYRLYILLSFLCVVFASCGRDQSQVSASSEVRIEDELFLEARNHQLEGRWTDAIILYKEILWRDYPAQPSLAEIELVSSSMLQFMNACQSASIQSECVEYFHKIYSDPSTIIKDYLWRDFLSIYAYALYRDDKDEEATEMIHYALDIEYTNPDENKLFRDFSYAAAIMYGNPYMQEEAISYCKTALELAEHGAITSGIQWTSSMLGRLYMKNGKFHDAMLLFQKSLKYSKESGDLTGLANAYNSLSDIYLFWRYPEQAESYSDSVMADIEQIRIQATSVAGDVYRIRGKIKNQKGETDSSLYYLNKALSLYEILPYNSGNDEVDKDLGSILIRSQSPSSREVGIKLLYRVLEKATRLEPKTVAYVNLSRMYHEQGDIEKCRSLMAEMSEIMLEDSSAVTYIDEDVCRFAFEFFMSEGNIPAANLFSNLYMQQVDRRSKDNVSRTIVSATQEDINSQHKRQIQKSLLLVNKIIVVALLLVIIISFAIYLYHRRKDRRSQVKVYHLEEDMKRLSEELNNMAQTISEYSDGQSIEDNLLLPHLFRKSGECVFREKFEVQYPMFLPKLRQAIPNISKNEEILCIMMFLNQDLNQIAYNMGIEKTSVNQARYRLRKKMGLNKEESLKEKILTLTNY